MSTIARLTGIFQQVFNDEGLTITRETTAEDVEGWDSLTHVTLLMTVEKDFGFRFSSSQVAGLKNVGELVDLIEKKAVKK